MAGGIAYMPLYTGTYFLLMTAVAAWQSAEVSRIGASITIMFWAVFYGAGILCGRRYRRSPSKFLKILSIIIIIIGACFAWLMFKNLGPLTALVVLLLWTQAGQNFVLSKRREFYFSYVISLVLVVYAASISQQASFIFYLTLYILSAMYVLMADYIDAKLSESQVSDGESMIRRMQISLRGFEIALLTIILSTVVYLLIPRFPSPQLQIFPSGSQRQSGEANWRGETGKEMDHQRQRFGQRYGLHGELGRGGRKGGNGWKGGYSGFSESFNISCLKKPSGSDHPVFLLKADRALYCRGKVFTLFDGENWASDKAESQILFAKNELFYLDDEYHDQGVKQKYLILRNLPPLLFAAYRPNALIHNGMTVTVDADRALRTSYNMEPGMIYFLKSDLQEIDGRPKGGKEECIKGEHYLQVPENLSARVRKLAHEITDGSSGDYEKTKAVEKYLKAHYAYSLETMNSPGKGEPVTEFLFDRKRGHGELFATSMVMLLRCSAIPARFVTGFPATRFSPFQGAFLVQERDAHAWVEAYINGHGWVTFEPTPSFEIPDKKIGAFYFFHFFDYADDSLQTVISKNQGKWWAGILDQLRQFVRKIAEVLKNGFVLVKKLLLDTRGWIKDSGWWKIPAFVAALMVVFLGTRSGLRKVRPVYFKWRLRRLLDCDPEQLILRCYSDMERWFGALGCPRPKSCTVTEYRNLLEVRYPDLAPHTEILTHLFSKVRYSPTSVTAEESVAAYEACLLIFDFREQNRAR